MVKLKKEDYPMVKNVLEENSATVPTFADAIVDGFIEGNIYTDDKVDPRSLVVETRNGKYFVCGEQSHSCIQVFKKLIDEKNEESLMIFSGNAAWDTYIENILHKTTIVKTTRTWFIFNAERFYEMKDTVPAIQTEVKSITRDLMNMSEKYRDSYYKSNWGNVDSFFTWGIGVCALHNDILVGECISIYRSNRKAEIDIFTEDDFRGYGLGFLLAKHFIATCLDENIIPTWDCNVINKASVRLAEKVGFDRGPVYSHYEIVR
ncbi:GNAT family N-acetyltransferase [Salipaludibacillus sp. CF4.18]|uniref:GNAT family N-acetyltransferase n=1 Tax=Salipaludibacillus sp. CF4.18 TaxID=3373081 RepID=UPI003EE47785